MAIVIRQLTEADLDWAAAVLAATGLVARQAELRRYLALEPGGYYAAEVDGRPAGLGGYVAYGTFACVGNMAVAYAPAPNAAAAALFARLGFVAHWESLRMRRPGPGAPPPGARRLGRPECLFGLAALALG